MDLDPDKAHAKVTSASDPFFILLGKESQLKNPKILHSKIQSLNDIKNFQTCGGAVPGTALDDPELPLDRVGNGSDNDPDTYYDTKVEKILMKHGKINFHRK